jgi:hypothetical protein
MGEHPDELPFFQLYSDSIRTLSGNIALRAVIRYSLFTTGFAAFTNVKHQGRVVLYSATGYVSCCRHGGHGE